MTRNCRILTVLLAGAILPILPVGRWGAAPIGLSEIPQIGDTAPPGTIQEFAISSDASFAVVAGAMGKVVSLSIPDGRTRTLVTRLPLAVEAVAISPRSDLAAVCSGGEEIYILSTADQNTRPRTIKTGLHSLDLMAFSPDDRLLAGFTSEAGFIPLWDVATGALIERLKPCAGRAAAIAFTLDGRRLASACDANMVRLWDLSTSRVSRAMGLSQSAWVNWIRFSGDGGRLFAATGGTNSIEVFDAYSGKREFALKGHTDQVDSFVLLPHNILISSSDDRTVRVWSLTTRTLVKTLEVPEGDIAGDGSVLLSRADEPGVLELWDLQTGSKIRVYKVW